MYLIKVIHISFALLAISGFVVRTILMIADSDYANARWIKIAPHVIDTVLLVSAISLAIHYGFTLFNSPWLLAKVIALLIYIAFGFIGLDLRATKSLRMAACLLAVVTFIYIASVAITKSPVLGLL